MAIGLYMDHHVSRAITTGLRLLEVDVLTAGEDGAALLPDPALLDRATSLGRVLFTQDDDLLADATRRQRQGIPFGGVIYSYQPRTNVGRCIRDLQYISLAANRNDVDGKVIFLPL